MRMSQQPAAAVVTDEQEQHQPQCRICLDGPDPDLGRLIRPCLCSGTVSVSTATGNFPPYPTHANRITYIALASHRIALKNAFRMMIVRTRRLPPALEEYLCRQRLCLLCMSTMPLPLPLCSYQDSRARHQPRFVPTSLLLNEFGIKK